MRLVHAAAAAALAAALTAAPARAAFHFMSIVEVFPGSVAAPQAQYVVLQMYESGQNFVSGHAVRFYDASGALITTATATFGGDVGNGDNQDRILIATAEAVAFFGITADLVMPAAAIRPTGGKVCFDAIDCVSWGTYGLTDVGVPFAKPVGLPPGRALRRELGADGVLQSTDDTNDSAADFDLAPPAPRNNARAAGAPPVSVCGNTLLESLEECDDGNAVPDDTCDAACSRGRLFADGFETDGLLRWHATATDAGDLTVGPAGALAGSAGLAGVVDDAAALYVQNDSPDDEPRYRARFLVDPSAFDPGEASGARRTRIFIAFEEAPQRRLLAVVLRRVNGQYALMGRARLDSGDQADTGFFAITPEAHAVEVDLKRASVEGSADGSFRLWIDGVLMGTLSGLDNDRAAVDFVRLGALSVKASAAGTLRWDEFDSRRQTMIGP